MGFAALSVGLSQACLEMSLAYVKERQTFGKPISQHQAIQLKLAEMSTKVEMAWLLVYKAAWLRDSGLPNGRAAAMVKLAAFEIAVRAADEAVQIQGGYGYVREFPISRFYLAPRF